MIEVYNKF